MREIRLQLRFRRPPPTHRFKKLTKKSNWRKSNLTNQRRSSPSKQSVGKQLLVHWSLKKKKSQLQKKKKLRLQQKRRRLMMRKR